VLSDDLIMEAFSISAETRAEAELVCKVNLTAGRRARKRFHAALDRKISPRVCSSSAIADLMMPTREDQKHADRMLAPNCSWFT